MALRQHGVGEGAGEHPADDHRQRRLGPAGQFFPVQRVQDALFGVALAEIRILHGVAAAVRPVQQGLGILHPPGGLQQFQHPRVAGGLHVLHHQPPGKPGQRVEPVEDGRRGEQLHHDVVSAAHVGQLVEHDALRSLLPVQHRRGQHHLGVEKAEHQRRGDGVGIHHRGASAPRRPVEHMLQSSQVGAAAPGELSAQHKIPRQHPRRQRQRHRAPHAGQHGQQLLCEQALAAGDVLQHRLVGVEVFHRDEHAAGGGQVFAEQVEQAGGAGQRVGHQHAEQKGQPEHVQKARAASAAQQSAQQQHEQKQNARSDAHIQGGKKQVHGRLAAPPFSLCCVFRRSWPAVRPAFFPRAGPSSKSLRTGWQSCRRTSGPPGCWSRRSAPAAG